MGIEGNRGHHICNEFYHVTPGGPPQGYNLGYLVKKMTIFSYDLMTRTPPRSFEISS